MAALTAAPRTYAPAKIQIELPNQPCALAWVGDALVAATYDYVEAEGTRVGGLCLLQGTEIAATLELRGGYALAPRGSQLAVATADGRVALVDVAETLTVSTASEPKGHLFTDVVWDGPDALVVAEGDSGRVSRWRADDGLVESQSWDAHAYAPGCPAEVWCVGRDPSTGLYVSGADDGLLRAGTRGRRNRRSPCATAPASRPCCATTTPSRRARTTSPCGCGTCARRRRRRRPLRWAAAPTRWRATRRPAPRGVHGRRRVRASRGALIGGRRLRPPRPVVYGAVRHVASRRIASCSFYDRGGACAGDDAREKIKNRLKITNKIILWSRGILADVHPFIVGRIRDSLIVVICWWPPWLPGRRGAATERPYLE